MISTKTKRAMTSLIVVVALISLAFGNMLTLSSASAQTRGWHEPPEGAPYGNEYSIGDKVPSEIMDRALKAASESRKEHGLIGVPYSAYDCSDTVETFLRDYVGFSKASVKGKTAQGFYDAFSKAGFITEVPKSARKSNDALREWLAEICEPGAILFWTKPGNGSHISHCGIYVGEGRKMDSITNGRNEGIKIRDIDVDVYTSGLPKVGGLIAVATGFVEKTEFIDSLPETADPDSLIEFTGNAFVQYEWNDEQHKYEKKVISGVEKERDGQLKAEMVEP